MYPRKETLEMFSTFVQFEADRFKRWVADTRLRHNMQQCMERSPEVSDVSNSESFWSLYWHKSWKARSHPLAQLHLSAYLQEPCYWAAQKALKKFSSLQFGMSDYFQTALTEMEAVLKGFNPDRGASLKTYAAIAFPSLLRDILRQRHEADLCTPWSLLCKISKKRLIEALQHGGLSSAAIEQYRLAWTCFKTLYVRSSPETTRPKPDSRLWEAVAQLYNAERYQQLPSPGSACHAKTIEQWLTNCAASIRNYLYPPVDSLNLPRAGQEVGEIQDAIADPISESLLAEIALEEEAQQRETQRTEIDTALKMALRQLDAQSQELMRLYYQEGLTQQQIIQQLQISQPTVSRRLTKAREALLRVCLEWSQQALKSSVNSSVNSSVTPTLIKDISTVLEEWLGAYYGKLNAL